MEGRRSTLSLKHQEERDDRGVCLCALQCESECIDSYMHLQCRWDETPASQRHGGGATPLVGGTTPSFSTPTMGGMGGATPSFGTATPAGALAMGLATPTPMAAGAMTPEQMQSWRWERELDERNRPLTDEELDALFPQEGYKVEEIK